jgi:hypothetical protein
MEEDRLFYPGSERLGDLAQDRGSTIEGLVRANTVHRLGSDDPESAILAWYEGEMAARGWDRASGVANIPGSTETTVVAWQRDGTVFRLSTLRKDHPLAPTFPEGTTPETIYEIGLMEDP